MHRERGGRALGGASIDVRCGDVARRWVAVGALLVGTACARADALRLPDTPLGEKAAEWLFAHNRGDGHAAVHFASRNRGERPSNGAVQDSVVQAAIGVSRSIGHLTPIALVKSTDSLLVLRMRTESATVWVATFALLPQPNLERVRVTLMREGAR